MATQSPNRKSAQTHAKDAAPNAKRDATPNPKRSAASTRRRGAAAGKKTQAQSVAETAVDLPVGAIISLGDRIAEMVEPWTARASAERQIKAYRTQLRRSLKRTERRGATARRRASAEARKTRARLERGTRSRARDLVEQLSDHLSTLR